MDLVSDAPLSGPAMPAEATSLGPDWALSAKLLSSPLLKLQSPSCLECEVSLSCSVLQMQGCSLGVCEWE